MTVTERREKVTTELQQAQQQAQAFGQQATHWAQRVLYLQGQLDLLTDMDGAGPLTVPIPPVPLTRAERRRQAKEARANGAT